MAPERHLTTSRPERPGNVRAACQAGETAIPNPEVTVKSQQVRTGLLLLTALSMRNKVGGGIRADEDLKPAGPVKKQACGRNAPCPCGRGKKYKRCCLPARR